jgi:hypothetical protein
MKALNALYHSERELGFAPTILILACVLVLLLGHAHGQQADQKSPTEAEIKALYNILMPPAPMSEQARSLFDPNYVPPVKKDGVIVRAYKSYDYSLKLDYARNYCAVNKPTAKHPKVQRVYVKNGDIYECATKTITPAGSN